MEINMDAYDCYVEELRYKGIPVDDFNDIEKTVWYVKYLDNLELEEDEQDLIVNETNEKINKKFEDAINKTILYQLKDDIFQLVGQLQLVAQRLERVEDQMYNDIKNKIKTVTN